MKRIASLLLLGFWMSHSPEVFAQISGDDIGISPFRDWETIESTHFRITFNESLKPLAPTIVQVFEATHRVLQPKMKWAPRTKTQVVILDNTDAANGFSAAAFRIGMVLFLTPPDSWFSTYHYRDWLELLILHEYTHHLNIDPTESAWEWLRWIFGDQIRPNSLWPSWMVEGLAVYFETKLTGAGRGTSPFYEAILRAAVRDGVLQNREWGTLDDLGGYHPYFPGGERPYFFGYQFMNEAANIYQRRVPEGDPGEMFGSYSLKSAGRFPYLINSNLNQHIGQGWPQVQRYWAAKTTARMENQLKTIRNHPLTSRTPLTQNAFGAIGCAVAPDEKSILFTHETNEDLTYLSEIDLTNMSVQKLTRKSLGSRVSISSDGRLAVYSSLGHPGEYQTLSDLWIWDRKSQSDHPLSHGLRAKDPHLSPDGKRIVFTHAGISRTGISVADLVKRESGKWELQNIQSIYQAAPFESASQPQFAPDGQSVAFSLHRNKSPQSSIVITHLPSQKVTQIEEKNIFMRYPTFRKNGRLIFIADHNGVDNLYEWDGKNTQRITNIETALAFPCVSPVSDRIFASELSTQGWDIVEVKPDAFPTIRSKTLESPPGLPIQEKEPMSQSSYSIFPSIWPRAWSPNLSWNSTIGFGAGAILTGADALDFHRYRIAGNYFSGIDQLGGTLSYTNRLLGLSWSNTLSYDLDTYGNSSAGGILYSQKGFFASTLSYPFQERFSAWAPSLGFQWERNFFYRYQNGVRTPSLLSGGTPSATAQVRWTNSTSSRLGIVREWGWDWKLGVRRYFLGDESNWKGLVQISPYWRLGRSHTVFAPNLAASVVSSMPSSNTDALVQTESLAFKSYPITTYALPHSLDQLLFRGYPDWVFLSQFASVGNWELKFPLARIFWGPGTFPFYMKDLWAFVFTDTAYLKSSSSDRLLASVGGGIHLTTEALVVLPLTFAVHYYHGLNESMGGRGGLTLSVYGGGLSF